MLILYYNTKGLNIIKNEKIINFPYFKSNYINLYNNNLIFTRLIKDKEDNEIRDYNSVFKLNENYNLFKYDLDFPYLKSSVHKNFTQYEFPKYYSPTFDYNNCENKYYLGVYQATKHIKTGEDTPIINFVVFLSDKNTGEIVWYWEMYQYFIDNNLSLDYDLRTSNPIIYAVTRVGKNNLGLNENDIMFTISKINQILIVEPFSSVINKIINISDIIGKNPSSFVDAHFIPEGLKGEGNLLFFNNNKKSLQPTEIIEYDLLNNEIIFEFGSEKMHNEGLGSSIQKLPNGNYFVYSYDQNKLLEITPSKEIIAEIIIDDESIEIKNDDYHRLRNCYVARQIPEEWASNFIENYPLIESVIKNYK